MLSSLRGAARRLALARPQQLPQRQQAGARRMMGGGHASGAPHHHQPKQVRCVAGARWWRAEQVLVDRRVVAPSFYRSLCWRLLSRVALVSSHDSSVPVYPTHTQAFLFNEGPGPRKVEIWEPITSITCECGRSIKQRGGCCPKWLMTEAPTRRFPMTHHVP